MSINICFVNPLKDCFIGLDWSWYSKIVGWVGWDLTIGLGFIQFHFTNNCDENSL